MHNSDIDEQSLFLWILQCAQWSTAGLWPSGSLKSITWFIKHMYSYISYAFHFQQYSLSLPELFSLPLWHPYSFLSFLPNSPLYTHVFK